jgi:hypothetical protein
MDPFVTRPSAASALTLRIRHHKCAYLAALACKKSSLAYKVNRISFSNFLHEISPTLADIANRHRCIIAFQAPILEVAAEIV